MIMRMAPTELNTYMYIPKLASFTMEVDKLAVHKAMNLKFHFYDFCQWMYSMKSYYAPTPSVSDMNVQIIDVSWLF